MPERVPVKEVSTADMIEMVLRYVEDQGGIVAFVRKDSDGSKEWVVSAEFGKEADDSPMAGGAAYGLDADLRVAVEAVAADCGLIAREPKEKE